MSDAMVGPKVDPNDRLKALGAYAPAPADPWRMVSTLRKARDTHVRAIEERTATAIADYLQRVADSIKAGGGYIGDVERNVVNWASRMVADGEWRKEPKP